ncbi:hypothetical protein [Clostridium baratii]|uniref:hypothetical protein n=1 Tax=Clostridium baratii TaxID=1561 RepID=UPI0030D320FC
MRIRIDKFFMDELKKNGYDIDFDTLIEIYKSSRKRPDFLEYKVNLIRDHEFLNLLDSNFKLK